MIYHNLTIQYQAITNLVGAVPYGEGWASNANGITDWNMLSVQPTEAAIGGEYNRLLAIYDTQQYARDRADAYNERGSTIQNLSVAMLESMDGSNPQKLIDLQIIRAQVKQDFPKPQ